MPTIRLPLALRLTGCWILWSAWCSVTGWGLSAADFLCPAGHLALFPVLLGAGWLWLRAASVGTPAPPRLRPWWRQWRRPLPLLWLTIAALSLLGALITPNPWSVDAASYRLPRMLDWGAAHHWYWIGTLDHRLDFSSCGYEWQALPLVEWSHSDRFYFLINFVPYLLMPSLVFQALRALGVRGRNAFRWMWLLPSGYCYALQCGGLQNDGYAVNYTLATVVLATSRFRPARGGQIALAVISAALLTGTKVSNLPLLLPLGILLWPALRSCRLFSWKTAVILTIAALSSFLPLAGLSLKHTGDWMGDPTDQWHVKIHNPIGGLAANLVIVANDALQPPILPGSGQHPRWVDSLEHRASGLFDWMKNAHGEFSGIHFGQMPYEAAAGLGFGLALYWVLLGLGCTLLRPPATFAGPRLSLHHRLVFAAAWLSFVVYLSKLGSYETARIAAPYYPLLVASVMICARPAWLERKRFFQILACVAALTVLPIIILTPARPLLPIQTLARLSHKPAVAQLAEQYHFWAGLRDDLAPLRDALPPDAVQLGYAGGFGETSYGLWKPFGSRVVRELGLPLGSRPLPPANMKYAVVTDRGLQDRYAMTLSAWLAYTHGELVFKYEKNTKLDAHSNPVYEAWYLVKF